jgi:hypothetical protein
MGSLRRRVAWVVTTAVPLALAGCPAATGPAPQNAGQAAGGFVVTERAESGPITAIAVRPPHMWAAGPAGLRRWHLGSGDYETVGAGEPGTRDPGTRSIAAIAIDDEDGAWVAGAEGLGRWVVAGDKLRYEVKTAPGRLTAVVARRPVATEGVWAGGPEGLYRFDGRGWTALRELQDVSVTSLSLDDDGKNVWVGTKGRGLFRTEGERAAPVPGGEGIVLDDVVGVGKNAAGTRLVAGNWGTEARIYALTMAGVEGFRAPGARAVALVDRRGGAVLVAGPRGSGEVQGFSLRSLAPADTVAPGSLRFAPIVPERGGRWTGVPTGQRLPPGVTVAAAGDADLYCGSQDMGVARAAAGRPEYFEGAELVGEARRLYVACTAPGRCLVVTDGPRAWSTDGDRFKTTPVGEPAGAAVRALVGDGQAPLYALSAEPQPPGIAITKLAAGPASAPASWQVLHRVALDPAAKRTPIVSFASLSPAGVMWVGLRLRDPSGAADDVGYGAVEIDLGNGHAVQHRPRRPNEPAASEALPLPSDLNGILFEGGVTWFASLAGVSRFQEGQLRSWGENEGLVSERVHAIGRVGDGAIWIATSGGLARFESDNWRPLGKADLPSYGFATDQKRRVWVATGKGLRVLAPGATDVESAPVVVDGVMRDVTVDRFGRVWALSSTSIALVRDR